MVEGSARRAFLSGRFTATAPMRPFGANVAFGFEDACTKCGDCAAACPENIIVIDPQGFPLVDLTRGECTFCSACTEACTTDALQPGRPWNWRASAKPVCLSHLGVHCRTCQDHCPEDAIRFKLVPGGRATLKIDLSACIGCGACASACPVDAVEFRLSQQSEEAA